MSKEIIQVNPEAYDPRKMAMKIVSLLPIVRSQGILILEEIAKTEDNLILQEGFRAIANGKLVTYTTPVYSKKDRNMAEAEAITQFVDTKCREYSFRGNELAKQVMAAGLYALEGGHHPVLIQRLYELALNSQQANLPNLKQLE